MSPPPRSKALEGLRGAAALSVVVLHVWMYTGRGPNPRPDLEHAVMGELRQGLTLFFVLSGFLLVQPWIAAALDGRPAPDLRRYFTRRLLRIVPAYWVVIAGSLAILAGTGHPNMIGADAVPAFLLFLQNQFELTQGRLNPPLWSLGIELSFYVSVPLIGWAGLRLARRFGRGGMLAGAALLALGGLGFTLAGELLRWESTVTLSLPTYLPLFACGIAAAVLSHGRRAGRAVAVLLALAGAVLVVVNGWWHHDGTGLWGHVLLDLPSGAGMAAVLVAAASRPPRALTAAPVVALGTVSYGLYLWHMPVLLWLWTRGELPAQTPHAVAAVLVPTLAAATASWVLVERPALRLGRRDRTAREPAHGHRPAHATA